MSINAPFLDTFPFHPLITVYMTLISVLLDRTLQYLQTKRVAEGSGSLKADVLALALTMARKSVVVTWKVCDRYCIHYYTIGDIV